MTVSAKIAKEDFEALKQFQHEIHTTDDPKEEIMSEFYTRFIKSTWYSDVDLRLAVTEDGDVTVYKVNNSFHYLCYTYMRYMLPSIRVKPHYKERVRIAWPHNVGSNIVRDAVFKEDDDAYHKFDNVWLDIYPQFYQDKGAGMRENYDNGVGNVPCLEQWSEFLPAYPINIDQPWFYSMHNSLAFPIFYKGSQTRAEHRYTFRKHIKDMLRVEILTHSGWTQPKKSIHTYLDIEHDAKLPIPELWGRYSYINDNEVTFHKSQCEGKRVFYTRDIEICDQANATPYKKSATVTLRSPRPCLAMFWVAENAEAIDNNNLSNYTTNSHDVYAGWDPIRSNTLTFGSTKRFVDMPSDHFSIAAPRRHFISAPSDRGYHAYAFAKDSTNYHGEVGVIPDDRSAELKCLIDDGNIFGPDYANSTSVMEDDDDDLVEPSNISSASSVPSSRTDYITKRQKPIHDDAPMFNLRVRLLVMRKFTIEKKSDDDDQFVFTIE